MGFIMLVGRRTRKDLGGGVYYLSSLRLRFSWFVDF